MSLSLRLSTLALVILLLGCQRADVTSSNGSGKPGTNTAPAAAPATTSQLPSASPSVTSVSAAAGAAGLTRAAASSESAASALVNAGGAPFAGTIGSIEVERQVPSPMLSDVRAASHEGFDRVVFTFNGPIPGYHIEYIDKPVIQCGSGDPVPIAGDAWLEVRMVPVDAHTPEGKPTILERSRTLELKVLRELKQTCDFEAMVTWVAGVHSPNPFRVLELQDPPRLVVDIATTRAARVSPKSAHKPQNPEPNKP